jgi:hypothetical protein
LPQVRLNHDSLERLKIQLLAEHMHPAHGSVQDVIDKAPRCYSGCFWHDNLLTERKTSVNTNRVSVSVPGFVVPQLIEAARDPRADLRALACRYLIESGAKLDVVVPILVTAASDVEEKVRYEAACAFGRLIAPGVPRRSQRFVTTHGKWLFSQPSG